MNAQAQTARLGEGDRCPHCGATAGVSKDGDGSHLCLVCGGPRIVVNAAIQRPGAEKFLLERVKALRSQRAAWFMATALVGGFSGLAALIGLGVLALLELSAFSAVALAVMVLVPALFAVYGFKKTKSASRQVHETRSEAQRVVAAELLNARPELSAAALSNLMQITEDAAVELLAHAQVGNLLKDDAPLRERYRVGPDERAGAPVEETPIARNDRIRRGGP